MMANVRCSDCFDQYNQHRGAQTSPRDLHGGLPGAPVGSRGDHVSRRSCATNRKSQKQQTTTEPGRVSSANSEEHRTGGGRPTGPSEQPTPQPGSCRPWKSADGTTPKSPFQQEHRKLGIPAFKAHPNGSHRQTDLLGGLSSMRRPGRFAIDPTRATGVRLPASRLGALLLGVCRSRSARYRHRAGLRLEAGVPRAWRCPLDFPRQFDNPLWRAPSPSAILT